MNNLIFSTKHLKPSHIVGVIVMSIIMILGGIMMIIVSDFFYINWNDRSNASRQDQLMFIFIKICGFLAPIEGFILIFLTLSRNRVYLSVYDDHIEGLTFKPKSHFNIHYYYISKIEYINNGGLRSNAIDVYFIDSYNITNRIQIGVNNVEQAFYYINYYLPYFQQNQNTTYQQSGR